MRLADNSGWENGWLIRRGKKTAAGTESRQTLYIGTVLMVESAQSFGLPHKVSTNSLSWIFDIFVIFSTQTQRI